MILVLAAVERPLLDSSPPTFAAVAALSWKYHALPFPPSFIEMEDGDREAMEAVAVEAACTTRSASPVLLRLNTFLLPLSSLIFTAVTKSELALRCWLCELLSIGLSGSTSLIGLRRLEGRE